MADNSAALRRARQRDGATKRRRSEMALDAMVQTGEPVTFRALASRAGVSVSFLYADTNLAQRVAEARDRQAQAGRDRAWHLPPRSLVTEASLRADLANAKEQIRRITEETYVLRGRLARELGAEADLARGRPLTPRIDQLEECAAELEADNHELRSRIAELEHEIRELNETLAAARAMNRDLMGEVNRSSPSRGQQPGRIRRGDPPRTQPPNHGNPTV